jgi:hypothetical protein
MKSTHNTLWAYTKIAAAALAMVTGTALLMAAGTGFIPPAKGDVQFQLTDQIQMPAGNGALLKPPPPDCCRTSAKPKASPPA